MDLNDFIKDLSTKDTKSLSQKTLKLTEEVGELARIVLPYESAHGTNHRFTDRESLLEEIVDIHLCNISILHSLGFTDGEFNDMLLNKSTKWSYLQSREEKAKFPLPFEIHVSVDLEEYVSEIWREKITERHGLGVIKHPTESLKEQRSEWRNTALRKFRDTCENIGIKPITLDLENSGNTVMKDVMTSSHVYGDNKIAYEECMRISFHLEKEGFKVIRKKIESVPWHPSAPIEDGDKMPEDCYFEAHIGCIISPEEKPILQKIAEETGSHLSRNFFKKMDNGKFVNMLTYRRYDNLYKDFDNYVNHIKELLNSKNIPFEKVITEFSVYDTNTSHDDKWLKNSIC